MLNNAYYVLKIYNIEGKKKLIFYDSSVSSLAKVYREILDKCFMPTVIYNHLKNVGDYIEFYLNFISGKSYSFLVQVERREYR